jgi:hypothetical protein
MPLVYVAVNIVLLPAQIVAVPAKLTAGVGFTTTVIEFE